MMILENGYSENLVSNLLGTSSILVLATSFENKVTARNVSCIILNNKIYFQTDKTFIKFHQISNNPKIAFCKDNIQIEGIANIKGHPLNKENSVFLDTYKKYYSNSYANYSHLKNEVVIEVEILFITMWVYENGKPLRKNYILKDSKFSKEYYNNY